MDDGCYTLIIMTQELTPFAHRVYEVTRQIPRGKVSTYKLVAQAVGSPGGTQAVGTALSRNPFAPEVPCHRVVSSDGTVGGFLGKKDPLSDPVQRKMAILREEGIEFVVSGRRHVVRDFRDRIFAPTPVRSPLHEEDPRDDDPDAE